MCLFSIVTSTRYTVCICRPYMPTIGAGSRREVLATWLFAQAFKDIHRCDPSTVSETLIPIQRM